VTDRERARLIGLLRQAADQLARDAYKLPNAPESPDCSETPKGSENPEVTAGCPEAVKSARNGHQGVKSARETHDPVKSARDDRRDHDRHPPRVL
jgi:hypothetical protein